jgi:hypothetical protein
MVFVQLALSALALQSSPLQSSQVSARRGFIAQAATAVAATAFVGVAPSQAGYLTNLGFGDASPAATEIDTAVRDSSAVQADLAKVQKYAAMAKELNAKVLSDPQADVKALVSAFNRAELRTSLNSVNSIFSEDFQKNSDRIVRNIIQDLSEIDSVVGLKPGVERSRKKIISVERFCSKLEKDLNEFLLYANGK